MSAITPEGAPAVLDSAGEWGDVQGMAVEIEHEMGRGDVLVVEMDRKVVDLDIAAKIETVQGKGGAVHMHGAVEIGIFDLPEIERPEGPVGVDQAFFQVKIGQPFFPGEIHLAGEVDSGTVRTEKAARQVEVDGFAVGAVFQPPVEVAQQREAAVLDHLQIHSSVLDLDRIDFGKFLDIGDDFLEDLLQRHALAGLRASVFSVKKAEVGFDHGNRFDQPGGAGAVAEHFQEVHPHPDLLQVEGESIVLIGGAHPVKRDRIPPDGKIVDQQRFPEVGLKFADDDRPHLVLDRGEGPEEISQDHHRKCHHQQVKMPASMFMCHVLPLSSGSRPFG